MAESDIFKIRDFKGNIPGGVAGAAIAAHAKCFAAIVAGAATFALSHIRHGKSGIFFGLNVKDIVVTGDAVVAQRFDVAIMAEADGAGFGHRHEHLVSDTSCRAVEGR